MKQGVYQSPSGTLFGFIVDHEKNFNVSFRMVVSGKEEFLRLLLDVDMPQTQKSNIMKMIDDDFQGLLKRREPQGPPPVEPVKRKKRGT